MKKGTNSKPSRKSAFYDDFKCLECMTPRENGLIRVPVTHEIAGSSPAGVAKGSRASLPTRLGVTAETKLSENTLPRWGSIQWLGDRVS